MLCLFAVFAFSCNEEMERLLTDDYPESGTEYTTGHVLMVVIDGASGIAVNEAYNTRKASVIRSMTDRSLFTFYGLADNEEGVSKERGWANLLTGTTKNGQICAPAQNPGFPYPPGLSISCPFLPFLSAADGTILHPSRSADSLFLFFHDHTHICPDSGYHCRTFLPGFHPHCTVSSENLPVDVPHCTHG